MTALASGTGAKVANPSAGLSDWPKKSKATVATAPASSMVKRPRALSTSRQSACDNGSALAMGQFSGAGCLERKDMPATKLVDNSLCLDDHASEMSRPGRCAQRTRGFATGSGGGTSGPLSSTTLTGWTAAVESSTR